MLSCIPPGANLRGQAVRIVIADRTIMASHLLAETLARNSHFNIVAIVSPAKLLASVTECRPDVAIVSADLDSGPRKGIEIARELRVRVPELRVIVFADAAEQELVVEAFRGGASALYCRAESPQNLHKCVERIYQGEIWADNRQVHFLVEALIATAPCRILDSRGNELLSGRLLEVVQYASKGYTNREIANKMKLSEHTVKNYLFRAFDRLGVSNRTELLFYVLTQQGVAERTETAPQTKRRAIEGLVNEAESGRDSAQFSLGTKYRDGIGVEKDKDSAYLWLRLAEEEANELSRESRASIERLKSRMDAAEIEDLERRVSEWLHAHRAKVPQRLDGIRKAALDLAV